MDIAELSSRLAPLTEQICHHLFPNGIIKQGEFCIGSLSGEKGSSLRVALRGSKTGIWRDFSCGDAGGDTIDLWAGVHRVSLAQARKEIIQHLGISSPTDSSKNRTAKKSYTIPPQHNDRKPPDGSSLKYLTETRKLSLKTLETYGVYERDGIVFPTIRNGQIVHYKRVDYSGEKKKILGTSKDTEPLLFGRHIVADTAKSLIITEGEIDAMTVHEMGFPCAVSIPFGAGTGGKQQWLDNEAAFLEPFEDIILLMDNDAPGFETAEYLAGQLGYHRTRIVSLPYNDINECWQNGWTTDDLSKAIEAGQYRSPRNIVNVAAYYKQAEDILMGREVDTGVKMPWINNKDDFAFRNQEVTLWTGSTGHGKTQALGQVVLHLGYQGVRSCIASMEIPPKRLVARLVRQACTVSLPSESMFLSAMDFLGEHVTIYNKMGIVDYPEMLEAFAYLRKTGTTHFVIDSLMKLDIAEDDYEGQKRFMNLLTEFVVENDCHVHLVAHPRKGQGAGRRKPTVEDISGSAHIGNQSNNIIGVWRDIESELKRKQGGLTEEEMRELDRRPHNELHILKGREMGYVDVVRLWFSPRTQQYTTSKNSNGRRYIDIDERPPAAPSTNENPYTVMEVSE